MSAETVTEMFAIELLALTAVRNADWYGLAVASEAWDILGYYSGALGDFMPGSHDENLDLIAKARYRRHRGKLVERAHGMIHAVRLLAQAGLLTERTVNLCRWPVNDPLPSPAVLSADLLAISEGAMFGRIQPFLSRYGLAVIPPDRLEEL